MKTLTTRLLPAMLALTAGLLVSCDLVEKVQTEPNFFIVSPESLTMAIEGQKAEVSVQCDFKWTASVKSGSWLNIKEVHNEGNAGAIEVTAAMNDSPGDRLDSIIVTSGSKRFSVAVHQIGLESILSVRELVVSGTEAKNFVVTSDKPWTAETVLTKAGDVPWFDIEPSSGGAGSTVVTVIPSEPNSSATDRSAFVKFLMGGYNFYLTVTQRQRDTSKDIVKLSKKTAYIEFYGDNLEVEVTSNVAYELFPPKEEWVELDGTPVDGNYRFKVHSFMQPGLRSAIAVFKSVDSAAADTLTVLQYGRSSGTFLDSTVPGIYGVDGVDYAYSMDVSQLGMIRRDSGCSFRVVWPSEKSMVEVEGLPLKYEIGQNVSLVRSIYSDNFNSIVSVSARVAQIEDDLVWLSGKDGGSFIVKMLDGYEK